jgi:hypothetical protein
LQFRVAVYPGAEPSKTRLTAATTIPVAPRAPGRYGAITNVDTTLGITLALDRFEILPLSFLDRWVQGEDSRI